MSPCLALIISTSFVTTSLVATTPTVTYAAYAQVRSNFKNCHCIAGLGRFVPIAVKGLVELCHGTQSDPIVMIVFVWAAA
jgi:hypothetical protein